MFKAKIHHLALKVKSTKIGRTELLDAKWLSASGNRPLEIPQPLSRLWDQSCCPTPTKYNPNSPSTAPGGRYCKQAASKRLHTQHCKHAANALPSTLRNQDTPKWRSNDHTHHFLDNRWVSCMVPSWSSILSICARSASSLNPSPLSTSPGPPNHQTIIHFCLWDLPQHAPQRLTMTPLSTSARPALQPSYLRFSDPHPLS